MGYKQSRAHRVRTTAVTVELVFGTKARLLKAVIDTAIADDDQPAAMLAAQ